MASYRRWFTLTAAGVLAMSPLYTSVPAYAEYPESPVTLIVPNQAGGSIQTLACVFAKALSEQRGQPVVVKTRPGGGVHGRYQSEINVLASMNATRLAASPDAPSIAEKYGIAMPSQLIVTAPKGLPVDVVAKLEGAIEAATKNADYLDLLQNKLLFPSKFVGSQALTADIGATLETLKKVAAETLTK